MNNKIIDKTLEVNYLQMRYQDNQYFLVKLDDAPDTYESRYGTVLKNVKIIFGDTVPNAIHIFGTEYMKNGSPRVKEIDREFIINGNFKISL